MTTVSRLLTFITFAICMIPSVGHTIEEAAPLPRYNRLLDFVLKPLLPLANIPDQRPQQTDFTSLYNNSSLKYITEEPSRISGCLETMPYAPTPLMDNIARSMHAMAAYSAENIEQLSVQPHFGGLNGPKIDIMRKDLENAVKFKGSANEIYHNADISGDRNLSCNSGLNFSYDIELNHNIDAWDSNESPLVRSEAVLNNRLHFGGYFLATVSANYLMYDTYYKEPDLRTLNRPDPVRQDVIGYMMEDFGLKRMMLSGLYTPKENFYVSAHAGYLEEMFAGIGGEFLYRPNNKALSFGGEAWGAVKRLPYTGTPLTVDENEMFISALVNIWYDTPEAPLSFGLSAGRFLDGDWGYQLRSLYKPAHGWRIEGYATYSGQSDATIDKDENTNWIIGARLSMPLGNIRGVPENSRQTFALEPIARDHGQRLDNPYPLYDLTEAWQQKHIINDWGKITGRQ